MFKYEDEIIFNIFNNNKSLNLVKVFKIIFTIKKLLLYMTEIIWSIFCHFLIIYYLININL